MYFGHHERFHRVVILRILEFLGVCRRQPVRGPAAGWEWPLQQTHGRYDID